MIGTAGTLLLLSLAQAPAPAPPQAPPPAPPQAATAARPAREANAQTVAVQRGMRLEIDDYAGEVTIKAWTRDEVAVEASPTSRGTLDVKTLDKVVTVRTVQQRVPRAVDYQITVPAWMEVKVSGTFTDITVEGTSAPITATNVRGDVMVRGGADRLVLKSIEGAITVDDARGRVEANAVEEAITLRNVAGDISAETVDGDITLDRVDAGNIEASTVGGDITLSGPIRDGGRYSLVTHDGDIQVSVPDGANLVVQVRTFDGQFSSNLAAQPAEIKKDRRYRLNIGTGSAQMDLESFDGEIRLRRPGTEGPRKGKTLEPPRDIDPGVVTVRIVPASAPAGPPPIVR